MLNQADLHDANLRGAKLVGTFLLQADLRGAHLDQATLFEADLRDANLSKAHLHQADFRKADLGGADLRGADLDQADLFEADLKGAKLSGAKLRGANLMRVRFEYADLSGADLSGADLREAVLVNTNLEKANLTTSSVYGISVWNVRLEGAIQSDLVITPSGEPIIQVDNLEVAQFLYLLLNNARIRHVIDTITSKVVLILGRFTPERKIVLDAIRAEVRKRDYVPVLFDFERPSSRDITETVRMLAHMARFVIADITDAKSIPQELMAIVPNLPSVPVQPVLLKSQQEYGMFDDFRRYPWVLKPVLYENERALLKELEPKVIVPAEAKANKQKRK